MTGLGAIGRQDEARLPLAGRAWAGSHSVPGACHGFEAWAAGADIAHAHGAGAGMVGS
ncbi:MAG TPA: hypothetical protein VF463_16640 [Sphingobium sp.]